MFSSSSARKKDPNPNLFLEKPEKPENQKNKLKSRNIQEQKQKNRLVRFCLGLFLLPIGDLFSLGLPGLGYPEYEGKAWQAAPCPHVLLFLRNA